MANKSSTMDFKDLTIEVKDFDVSSTSAVADAGDASGTYDQAEAQDTVDQLNALLAELRTAGIIPSS